MPRVPVASDRFATMGTRAEVHLFGELADAPAVLHAIRSTIERVDRSLTTHRDSPTTALNASLAKGEVAYIEDDVLLRALTSAIELHLLTHGLFDVAISPVTSMRGGLTHLSLDVRNLRVEADRPIAIDFGGLGKGLALDDVGLVLQQKEVQSAMLSLGESSLLAWGHHPHGDCWQLRVPHPQRADEYLTELQVRSAGVSISSTVLDAHSPTRLATCRPGSNMEPERALTAVSVEASAARAEALSTAALVASPEEFAKLAQRPGAGTLQLFDVG